MDALKPESNTEGGETPRRQRRGLLTGLPVRILASTGLLRIVQFREKIEAMSPGCFAADPFFTGCTKFQPVGSTGLAKQRDVLKLSGYYTPSCLNPSAAGHRRAEDGFGALSSGVRGPLWIGVVAENPQGEQAALSGRQPSVLGRRCPAVRGSQLLRGIGSRTSPTMRRAIRMDRSMQPVHEGNFHAS